MSKPKTKEDLNGHKKEAIENVSNYIDSLIESDDKDKKKADLLCYWISDYTNFLKRENCFDPKRSKKYKRGDIIKVHLGFRVGSEEGGLHYAVVLDIDNSLSSPVITIVPLTSIKAKTDIDNLPDGCVYLGNEIFNSITLKATTLMKNINASIEEAKKDLTELETADKLNTELSEQIDNKINKLKSKLLQYQRTLNEINKMKKGSIALVRQIVTISKLRIYDPKCTTDALDGVKLSDVNLSKIDEQILLKFTKCEKSGE